MRVSISRKMSAAGPQEKHAVRKFRRAVTMKVVEKD